MDERVTLRSHLDRSVQDAPNGPAVAAVIEALATASIDLAALIADGPLAGITGRHSGVNSDGDLQKDIDVAADEMMRNALRATPVAAILSEEAELPETLDAGAARWRRDRSARRLLQPRQQYFGRHHLFDVPRGGDRHLLPSRHEQIAGGYIVYGPHVALVFTLGEGVAIFVLDRVPETSCWSRRREDHAQHPEFAINASNYRHWHGRSAPTSTIASKGPRASGTDFNMRWVASLVAETHRILVRGGVFLYPADERRGYREGRLRLLYEAHPIAFLVEQAGGAATAGRLRILDMPATTLHQRTPLIFGSIARSRASPPIHQRSTDSRCTRPCSGNAACSAETIDVASIPSFPSPAPRAQAPRPSSTRSTTSSAARRSPPPNRGRRLPPLQSRRHEPKWPSEAARQRTSAISP